MSVLVFSSNLHVIPRFVLHLKEGISCLGLMHVPVVLKVPSFTTPTDNVLLLSVSEKEGLTIHVIFLLV